MNTNPIVDISPKSINCSVGRHFETALLTHDEARALIKHAPDERSRLWFRLLYDTGLRRDAILNLHGKSLWTHDGIMFIQVWVDDGFCRPPIRDTTVRALMAHMKKHQRGNLVFPGNRTDLALDMELSLRLASLRADIGKWPNTGVFRRMKVWDYRVADVGPGVVARAIGQTREFGSDRGIGLLEGLREAKRVLEMEPGVVEDLRKRIVNGVKGFLLGY